MLLMRNSRTCREIREYLDTLPILDTHEHHRGICTADPNLNIFNFLLKGYHGCDTASSYFDEEGKTHKLRKYLNDSSVPFDQRYETWYKYYDRCKHTAYMKSLADGLRHCWGIEDFSKGNLLELQERMRNERNQLFFNQLLEEQNIKAMIVDNGNLPHGESVFDGAVNPHPKAHFAIGIPPYHTEIGSYEELQRFQMYTGQEVNSLDDYLSSLETVIQRWRDQGAVCLKDQAAYKRKIYYEKVERERAETIFTRIVNNPECVFDPEDTRPLDDFLFHALVRLAKQCHLPVQLHTGHMTGLYNEISKTNAVHLTNVLDEHRDVRFDLFHGNWPYMGELLYLAKNYPNVSIDMCWVHAIDPLYSIELLKRALVTVPHSKIFGFGGDTPGNFEASVGYLHLAKDNIACALSELVDSGWMGMTDAQEISYALLFENPHRVFFEGLNSVRID